VIAVGAWRAAEEKSFMSAGWGDKVNIKPSGNDE